MGSANAVSGLMRRILVGTAGLRAGWSALLFVAIWLCVVLAVGPLLRALLPGGDRNAESPVISVIREGVNLAALFIAVWVMAKVERRSLFKYGLADGRALSRFGTGAVLGIISVSALVGLLWWNHFLVFDARVLSGPAMLGYAAFWALICLITGLFEENLFRGYLQHTLTRGLNFWWATVITSLLFGAAHGLNPGESPAGLFAGVCYGLMCCLSLKLTGSLWLAIGIHAGWDWAESYLYGVSDSGSVADGRLFATHPIGPTIWSGGATGPEGSVYALLIIAVLTACIWALWGRGIRIGDD